MILSFLAQLDTLPLDPLTQYGALGLAFFIVIGVLRWQQSRLVEKDKAIVDLANDHRDKMLEVIEDSKETNAKLQETMHRLDKNVDALAIGVQYLGERVSNLESRR